MMKSTFLSALILAALFIIQPAQAQQHASDPFLEDTKTSRALIREIIRLQKQLKREVRVMSPSFVGRMNGRFTGKLADNDQDGLGDLIENVYGYNSAKTDSDESGETDGEELSAGRFTGKITSLDTNDICVKNKLNVNVICGEMQEDNLILVDSNDQPLTIEDFAAGDCVQAQQTVIKLISFGTEFRWYFVDFVKKLAPALCPQ